MTSSIKTAVVENFEGNITIQYDGEIYMASMAIGSIGNGVGELLIIDPNSTQTYYDLVSYDANEILEMFLVDAGTQFPMHGWYITEVDDIVDAGTLVLNYDSYQVQD